MDSLGGGLVIQSLLALWLPQRFNLSLESTDDLLQLADWLAEAAVHT